MLPTFPNNSYLSITSNNIFVWFLLSFYFQNTVNRSEIIQRSYPRVIGKIIDRISFPFFFHLTFPFLYQYPTIKLKFSIYAGTHTSLNAHVRARLYLTQALHDRIFYRDVFILFFLSTYTYIGIFVFATHKWTTKYVSYIPGIILNFSRQSSVWHFFLFFSAGWWSFGVLNLWQFFYSSFLID